MGYSLLELSASLAPEYGYCGVIEASAGAELLIGEGEPASAYYPEDPEDVMVHFDPTRGGPKLASRIGNTRQLLLMAREAVAQLATQVDLGAFEVHGLTLINHKRRIHSRDYVFVNPLTRRPLADHGCVFHRFESTGRIYACTRWVLASARLEGAPDLLRAAEFPTAYFVSPRFVDAVDRLGLSNFAYTEVEHR